MFAEPMVITRYLTNAIKVAMLIGLVITQWKEKQKLRERVT